MLKKPQRSLIISLQYKMRDFEGNPLILFCFFLGGVLKLTEFQSALVTRTLNTILEGDQQAGAELLPILYSQLRNLARSLMAGSPPGNTLQPTALVHEAYLRLNPEMDPGWKGKGHFFAAAALAMRRILVDQARRKGTVKHGGLQSRASLDPDQIPFATGDMDFLELDQALDDLQNMDSRKAEVVMLRYFTGLTIAETAQALQISEGSVQRDWRLARLFLYERLAELGSGTSGRNHGL